MNKLLINFKHNFKETITHHFKFTNIILTKVYITIEDKHAK